MDRIEPTPVCTYAELRRTHEAELAADERGIQQIRNQLSSLSFFMRCHSRSEGDSIIEDFGAAFETLLHEYDRWSAAEGYSATTVKNRVSHIRSVKETAVRLIEAGIIKESFRETLKALLAKDGMSIAGLAAKLKGGCTVGTLEKWIRGDCTPTRKKWPVINEIEKIFKLPSNSLLCRIGGWETFKNENSFPVLEERMHLAKLHGKKRYVELDFPDAVKEEWKAYVIFKTAPYLLHGLKRNSTWRVKDPAKVDKRFKNWATETPYGICVTADMNWSMASRFFSWLLQNGHTREQLTLGLFSDAHLVIGFIEFLKGRRGKYTGGHKYIFQMALSMLRAKTGYIWQKPEFAERLGKSLTDEAWRTLCEKNRATLLDVYRELGKGNHFKKGRDPFHAIASIVGLQHPIDALFEMVSRMERSIPSTSKPSTNALHARNILLMKMLICNPLRVQQYAMMTWCADNTGNLYTGPDGEWRMRFEPVDFKNHYGAANQPYDVALSEWLRRDIDAYLTVYRPYFRDAATSNSLFLPRGEKEGRTRDYLSAAVISSTVLKLTRKFIPGCPGFSAHAFRHIIATEYIKNNPNGFQVAANILHDRLETVMRAYAHLKVADGFSFWTAYLDRQIVSYQTQGAVNE